MASFLALTQVPDILDHREIWFTNMLLLGFEPLKLEEKHKIPFSRDMFCHINKKGMEVVVHFLFSKLSSNLAYEEFRDCWPVFDKKQEQQFRKACSNWLARISKEEPESKLPRIAASVLLSPSGDKFYHFLLRFSGYVLKVHCLKESKSEEKDILVPTFLSAQEDYPALRSVGAHAARAHVVRNTRQVVGRLELAAALHDKWKDCACQLTAKYRAATKERKKLLKHYESLKEEKAQSKTAKRVSSTPSDSRDSRVQKARELWKRFEKFESRTQQEREVINCILQDGRNKYSISGKDIDFQIPDIIIQEYGDHIREGLVGNTFEAGKLNLLSLFQVYNCSLQVVKNKMLNYDVPGFEEEAQHVACELETHRGNLSSAQKLSSSLEDLLASVHKRTGEMEEELEQVRSSAAAGGTEPQAEEAGRHRKPLTMGLAHHSPLLRVQSIPSPGPGLELLPPSPILSQQLSSPHDEKISVKKLARLRLSDHKKLVSTPEAVREISRSVLMASQQSPSLQRQKQPVAASSSSIPRKRIHQPALSSSSSSHSSSSSLVSSHSRKDEKREEAKMATGRASGLQKMATPTSYTGQKARNRRPASSTISSSSLSKGPSRATQKRGSPGVTSKRNTTPLSGRGTTGTPSSLPGSSRKRAVVHQVAASSGNNTSAAGSRDNSSAVTNVGTGGVQSTPKGRPKETADHEELVDKIVAAVTEDTGDSSHSYSPSTPQTQFHLLMDPESASREDMIETIDLIPRTPINRTQLQDLSTSTSQQGSWTPEQANATYTLLPAAVASEETSSSGAAVSPNDTYTHAKPVTVPESTFSGISTCTRTAPIPVSTAACTCTHNVPTAANAAQTVCVASTVEHHPTSSLPSSCATPSFHLHPATTLHLVAASPTPPHLVTTHTPHLVTTHTPHLVTTHTPHLATTLTPHLTTTQTPHLVTTHTPHLATSLVSTNPTVTPSTLPFSIPTRPFTTPTPHPFTTPSSHPPTFHPFTTPTPHPITTPTPTLGTPHSATSGASVSGRSPVAWGVSSSPAVVHTPLSSFSLLPADSLFAVQPPTPFRELGQLEDSFGEMGSPNGDRDDSILLGPTTTTNEETPVHYHPRPATSEEVPVHFHPPPATSHETPVHHSPTVGGETFVYSPATSEETPVCYPPGSVPVGDLLTLGVSSMTMVPETLLIDLATPQTERIRTASLVDFAEQPSEDTPLGGVGVSTGNLVGMSHSQELEGQPLPAGCLGVGLQDHTHEVDSDDVMGAVSETVSLFDSQCESMKSTNWLTTDPDEDTFLVPLSPN